MLIGSDSAGLLFAAWLTLSTCPLMCAYCLGRAGTSIATWSTLVFPSLAFTIDSSISVAVSLAAPAQTLSQTADYRDVPRGGLLAQQCNRFLVNAQQL